MTTLRLNFHIFKPQTLGISRSQQLKRIKIRHLLFPQSFFQFDTRKMKLNLFIKFIGAQISTVGERRKTKLFENLHNRITICRKVFLRIRLIIHFSPISG